MSVCSEIFRHFLIRSREWLNEIKLQNFQLRSTVQSMLQQRYYLYTSTNRSSSMIHDSSTVIRITDIEVLLRNDNIVITIRHKTWQSKTFICFQVFPFFQLSNISLIVAFMSAKLYFFMCVEKQIDVWNSLYSALFFFVAMKFELCKFLQHKNKKEVV